MSRRSMSARHGLRYNALVNSASTRRSKPGQDYGLDNFTYDPEKVEQWSVPKHINGKDLPRDVYKAVKDWVLSGAAIDTALERIRELEAEAARRAFPSYDAQQVFATRKASAQSSLADDMSDLSLMQSNTSTVPSTPATSFSTQPHAASPPPKLDTVLAASSRKYVPHPNQLPDSITSKPGMESPPFTPTTRSGSESGSGARSPAMLPRGYTETPVTPDFNKLSAQLSPLMSPSSGSFASDGYAVQPDMLGWYDYISDFRAELYDLKVVALPRLKGHEYTVTKTLFMFRANPPEDLTWATADACVAFADWWKTAKLMLNGREAAAASLELPCLEDMVGSA